MYDLSQQITDIRINTTVLGAGTLRELTGPEVSNPNETRAEFIHRLVQQANLRLTGHSVPALRQTPGGQTVPTTLKPVTDPAFWRIRFIAMLMSFDGDAELDGVEVVVADRLVFAGRQRDAWIEQHVAAVVMRASTPIIAF